MFQKILVVCTGNICRSPVGAAFLTSHLPGRAIASAGLAACIGRPVDPAARSLAERDGLRVDDHLARQLTPELVHNHQLILVMGRAQRDGVVQMVPESWGKTMLFGKWLGDCEIEDPYRQSVEVFARTHEQLKAAATAWAARLE
ncbi:protein tyrosine phosphatase [Franzmannia pantelleriensis]|uniref:protein-tyrosine-phosphatase n=1 Tax=Franzmannia pantelleriensis TaxID=48727 RepID=A0A1G9MFK0_9GAMM|nr:low molecular weight protein-tyrosine-phosphatase [Halomonas pantelleriensis]SDL72999.1 protein tyrosine phosphatase [Halomonas pantelleriensis]